MKHRQSQTFLLFLIAKVTRMVSKQKNTIETGKVSSAREILAMQLGHKQTKAF